jgi:hypothetical protein
MLYFDAAPVATSNPFSVSGEPSPSRNREMPGDTRDRGRMRRPALEHDPEKWVPVFPRDKRQGRLRGDHAQTKR